MPFAPEMAQLLTDVYWEDPPLFVGGDVLWSREGTTQGDPLAMAMFAIAIRPLIERVAPSRADQSCFADDTTSGGP